MMNDQIHMKKKYIYIALKREHLSSSNVDDFQD